MLSLQDNELLTRTGLGTPMGALFRRFWHPALLSEELPVADGTPVRLRVLGENLVAFRDTQGKVGIVDALCPHRRAGMFFGRSEEHTYELQSLRHLVCRLLLEKKKKNNK